MTKPSLPKAVKKRSKHRTKRMLTVKEILEATGEDPIRNLIRIAHKAENAKEYSTASSNWKEILSYVQAKMKPTDPTDNAARAKQQSSLDQIAELKQAILKGAVEAIEPNDGTIIDVEPVRIDPYNSEFI